MTKQQNIVDFMVVGQGLAGSILAWHLMRNGISILVIDDQHKDASSVVAAGIINPITGHRINVTDGMDRFLPDALSLYHAMEKQFKTSLIHALPQLRLIKKQGQLDYWQQRQQQASHQPYLGELHEHHDAFSESAFGIAEIKQTYRVSTEKLLRHCREWLIEQNALYNQRFDYQTLEVNESGVKYKDVHAKGVIFCEGFQAIHNPWWKHLPFKLAKGEIITLKSDDLPHAMLNWGSWLLPISEPMPEPMFKQRVSSTQHYKLGSNYAWNNLDLTPNQQVKEHLLTSMHSKVSAQASVLDHQVGVRPTTLHRQAFVGGNSQQQRLFCFNGFGSKGCLTIPYHANLLTQHIVNGVALPVALTQYL